ncbi:hypothetical protein JCM19037_448 [Geomicrobium sp. JCM 19037]|uniref:hypothetical protein n=1 Tax=Geomicrobium sp. JCM 19037 TaxID=1460634 RepID=UPI00045F19A1|nr:hypothetical protein [Geomicrobium sp. JCM 19037]GAK02228.1 hypothetical protein JCM19037_448 [Geomicrobium sp. JCM 19037]
MDLLLVSLIFIAYMCMIFPMTHMLISRNTDPHVYYVLLPTLVGLPVFFMSQPFVHEASTPIVFAASMLPFTAIASSAMIGIYYLKLRRAE